MNVSYAYYMRILDNRPDIRPRPLALARSELVKVSMNLERGCAVISKGHLVRP